MAVESLDCPNCGAALPAGSAGTVICRFCRSTVRLSGVGETPPASVPDVGDRVRRLLEERRTLEAIRLYRDSRACTLKEARDGVAATAAEMGLTLGSGRPSGMTCPVLSAGALAWLALMILLPHFFRKMLEAGRPFSQGKAALVQGGAILVLLALSVAAIWILTKRSARLRGPDRGDGKDGPR